MLICRLISDRARLNGVLTIMWVDSVVFYEVIVTLCLGQILNGNSSWQRLLLSFTAYASCIGHSIDIFSEAHRVPASFKVFLQVLVHILQALSALPFFYDRLGCTRRQRITCLVTIEVASLLRCLLFHRISSATGTVRWSIYAFRGDNMNLVFASYAVYGGFLLVSERDQIWRARLQRYSVLLRLSNSLILQTVRVLHDFRRDSLAAVRKLYWLWLCLAINALFRLSRIDVEFDCGCSILLVFKLLLCELGRWKWDHGHGHGGRWDRRIVRHVAQVHTWTTSMLVDGFL